MRYLIVIEKGPANCSAYCPDVPGCVATGLDVEQATAALREALGDHLEDEEAPAAWTDAEILAELKDEPPEPPLFLTHVDVTIAVTTG